MMDRELQTADILSLRGPKNVVSPEVPYAFSCEPERARNGEIVEVATVFLTNRECPFRCLMCDLWKNTTDETVPAGAIPRQIHYALQRLPPATHIKLYNSGNFFDVRAIPPGDHAAIARACAPFEHIVIETHPKLCGDRALQLRNLFAGTLEVALGLETANPMLLAKLNKQMTRDDFAAATRFLRNADISVRAFILLKPPYTSEMRGIELAIESAEYAFEQGADCCVIIPTRRGNGAIEHLEQLGQYSPPRLKSLEAVLEAMLPRTDGRVFVDVWDAQLFATCPRCVNERIERLQQMNLSQQVAPRITCNCDGEQVRR